jgi:hypothetical protein
MLRIFASRIECCKETGGRSVTESHDLMKVAFGDATLS